MSADGATPSDRGGIARPLAILALAVIAGTVVYMFAAAGGSDNRYRLLFQTGGQLVSGNQVLIGGTPVGTVDSIKLNDDAQAEVEISLDRALHEGSTAVIRSTSLSGVANRYVSIAPGPNSAPEFDDGQVIPQDATTTPVDLDQLFDTFDEKTRDGLSDLIRGQGQVYDSRGADANRTYRYFSPSLVAARRLFEEVNADQQVLSQFLVEGGQVMTALSERRDDISGLVSNGNQALGAIASQNDALDRSLVALPPTLRQANTTFVNLRAAFDDLDPLVATSKSATKNLAPFLRKLRRVATRSVPVFKNLKLAVNRTGTGNDLYDFTKDAPEVRKRAVAGFPDIIKGERCSAVDGSSCGSTDVPFLKFLRPYTPELLNAVTKLSQVTAAYDADGHYARVSPFLPVFDQNPGTGDLTPYTDGGGNAPYQDYSGIDFRIFRRCPGNASQIPADLSAPFLDNGGLSSPADCDATDVPPGP